MACMKYAANKKSSKEYMKAKLTRAQRAKKDKFQKREKYNIDIQ